MVPHNDASFGRTVRPHVGTFSKVLFRVLRLSYLVIPERLVHPSAAGLIAAGAGTPTLIQAAVYEFLVSGAFVRHLPRMRKLYAERRDLLVAVAARQLDGLLAIERTEMLDQIGTPSSLR